MYRLFVYTFNVARPGTRTWGSTSSYQSISNEGASNIEEGTTNESSADDILLDTKGNQTEHRLFTSFLLLLGVVNVNYLLTVHNIVINAITLVIAIFQIFVVVSYWTNCQQLGILFYNVCNLLAFILIATAILGEGDMAH
ncbi:hypothetical protein CONCODRAFT_83252 [Conidiobolus coronatus NRRL 28638]|uniref:Uncharacterized protein n=1 Tax=Conidiobolus coronatus (strain ATCC 28846 / CBS 209.66 / NRRL 28638) TaxID=796925 RepID=A0A137PFS3_CONC2|nr:hypothetical protein CONCODRAFT_83252 [Conidiobolus coronatus NRRL 28638]|eukprot:KXN73856.1 hypothetical protein CONCODRAFT_83252 [Conidiobolus coronatus NRRL 28638]